jgi:hypothetical protein
MTELAAENVVANQMKEDINSQVTDTQTTWLIPLEKATWYGLRRYEERPHRLQAAARAALHQCLHVSSNKRLTDLGRSKRIGSRQQTKWLSWILRWTPSRTSFPRNYLTWATTSTDKLTRKPLFSAISGAQTIRECKTWLLRISLPNSDSKFRDKFDQMIDQERADRIQYHTD